MAPEARPIKPAVITSGGLRFGVAGDPVSGPKAKRETREARAPRVKVKTDSRHVAAARGLRDWYLEQMANRRINPPVTNGKYDVTRGLGRCPSGPAVALPMPSAA